MNPAERLALAKLSLEGLALGDAYDNHHGNNPNKNAAPIWEFSDDTLMALSIVENLRKYGSINQDALAESFAHHWDGNRGYGQGITKLLKSIRRGQNWRQAAYDMFEGQGSYGNGAAMRVAPLGAFFADDIERVVQQARASAVVTHAHPEGIAGAIAIAVATAAAYQLKLAQKTVSRQEFLEQIIPYIPESEVQRKIILALELAPDTSVQKAAEVLGNGRPVLAQLTVPFTLWAAGEFMDSYEKAIRQTASGRGDVDTNCAIVGGIVVMFTGIEAIPETWYKRRERLPQWPFQDEIS
jgi:ADP-ribosylglycohydrolase